MVDPGDLRRGQCAFVPDLYVRRRAAFTLECPPDVGPRRGGDRVFLRQGRVLSKAIDPAARLTEVSGRCPPEDCGGPWGYAELIEAIKDPKHERHDELTEWIGDDFDPHADQAEWLTAEVEALAKKWSRKPASKRARRA